MSEANFLQGMHMQHANHERSGYKEQYAATADMTDNSPDYRHSRNKNGLYQRPLAKIFVCFHQGKCILRHEAAWLYYIGMLQGYVRVPCKRQERCFSALSFGCLL